MMPGTRAARARALARVTLFGVFVAACAPGTKASRGNASTARDGGPEGRTAPEAKSAAARVGAAARRNGATPDLPTDGLHDADRRRDAGPLRLRFLGNVDFPPRAATEGRAFGGISALAFLPVPRTLLALSDGHDGTGPPRAYELDFDRDAFDIRVRHRFEIDLSGTGVAPEHYDPEGLALSPVGDVLVASEGDQRGDRRIGPRLDAFRRDRHRFVPVRNVPLPAWTKPETGRGVRPNRGPEALTRATRYVFVGFEEALRQDGPPAAARPPRGTDVRILRFGVDLTLAGAHHYRTDVPPTVTGTGQPPVSSSVGLTELAAIDDEHLLALERSTYQDDGGQMRNRIRLYLIDVGSAPNVLRRETLSGHAPIAKRLVLDFDTIRHRLFPKPELDNFEAMAVITDDTGRCRHLIVASDDNFRSDQRTSFVLFAVDGTADAAGSGPPLPSPIPQNR
ncbi:MAG: esterase-like activity of phytase family protein [Myxococcota bacterium]